MITGIQPYQIYFKSYDFSQKPYEQKGFVRTQKIPDEGDILELSINANPEIKDPSNIYSTIGKIFEEDGLLAQAKMCFEKNAQLLQKQHSAISRIRDNEEDLMRINEKIQSSQVTKG